MPKEIAILLLALLGIMGFAAVGVALHKAWEILWPPLRTNWGLQFLIYRKRPNPLQWLIDIAENQRRNPISHLVITDRIIMGVHLNDHRPRLQVRVCFTNLGMHDLIISQPEGYPYFGNEKSTDYIRDEGGYHTVPDGNSAASFNLDIYIPAEFLDGVRKEVESPPGEVRSISLGRLRVMVRVSAEGAPSVRWSIGARENTEIFRPNR